LTFALLRLASMRLIGAAVPQQLAATGRAFYALGPSLVTALLTLALGANGLLLIALLSAVALWLVPGLKTRDGLT